MKTPLNYYWIQANWAGKKELTIKAINKYTPSAINITFKGNLVCFEINEEDAELVTYRNGRLFNILINDIYDMIQKWHELPRTVNISIYKFLNCTPKAYAKWVEKA